jgi:RNA polymerase sigma-70 factor, ECF subfamily
VEVDTVSPSPVADTAGRHGDVELDRLRKIVADEVERVLLSLPGDARTVILLDLEGLSEAEVAAVLGCPVGTVKSRLSRARAALRQRLTDLAP